MSAWQRCRYRLLLQATALLSAQACAASVAGWPELPAGAQVVDVGGAMRINGLPVQVRAFLSPQPVADLAVWFRSRLGSSPVASQHGGKTMLGQASDDRYLTVQLEAAGSGARGLIAQADVAALMAGRIAAAADQARWQARLPAGMRILGLVESRSPDGGRRLQHLVLQSRGPLADSGAALARMLAIDGYGPARSAAAGSPPGLVLHFQKPGGDAMAVLTRNADGTNSTVLSASAQIEGRR
jgi:hypothetical protein